jgi:predicted phage terminase large subunit-like protein
VGNKLPLHIRAQAELIRREREKLRVAPVSSHSYTDIAKAKSSMLDFTHFTFTGFQVNWHHKVLCKYLDKFLKSEILNLMIFMPPQHGKSELASRRFPAYWLGHNPAGHVIFCTHTDNYARRINRDVQRIISSDNYKEIFPETVLPTPKDLHYSRTTDYFDIVHYNGSFYSASVGGSITGNPADLLILDDPYPGPKTAISETKRRHIWDWFNFDFLARKSNENAKVLIIQTRWHEDDLSGRILKDVESHDFTVLKFPAIAEELKHPDDPRETGEPLWPERFSLDYFEKRKKKGGIYWFSSVFQQSPQPEGGGLFKRKYFQYFTDDASYYNLTNTDGEDYTILKDDCQIFCTMDLAVTTKETSDYTVFLTFALTPAKDILILDIYRVRVEGAEHMSILANMNQRWKPSLIGIESVQYQLQLVQSAIKKGFRVKELKPGRSDKKTRALPILARMESGHVYFKADAHWLQDFEEELLSFPNTSHDDQIDAFAFTEYMIEPEKDWEYPLLIPEGGELNSALPKNGETKIFQKQSVKGLIL